MAKKAPLWRVVGTGPYHNKRTARWEVKCFEDGRPKSYYRKSEAAARAHYERCKERYAAILAGKQQKIAAATPVKGKGWDAILQAAAKRALASGDYAAVGKLAEAARHHSQLPSPASPGSGGELSKLSGEELVSRFDQLASVAREMGGAPKKAEGKQ